MRKLARLLICSASLAVPSLLTGQGLTVQRVTDMRFQGALGTVVNIAAKTGGVNPHNIATTTYLQGHRMRTDDATSGTIVDLDGERVTTIDHKDKMYTTMTFAEMAVVLEKAQQQMKQQSPARSSSTPPEGEHTQQVGSMVFLMHDWVSTNAPQIAAYKEFYNIKGAQAVSGAGTRIAGCVCK